MAFVDELTPRILQLMQDSNGHHVVQRIILVVARKSLDPVMDALRGQVVRLSSHRDGCRVVQKMLLKGTDKDKTDIFNEFIRAADVLAPNLYGNYVAQALLEEAAESEKTQLINLLIPMAIGLSKHQAASNVVEKCISFGTLEHARELHRQFVCIDKEEGRPYLVAMLMNQYANYTIREPPPPPSFSPPQPTHELLPFAVCYWRPPRPVTNCGDTERLFEKFGNPDKVGPPAQGGTARQNGTSHKVVVSEEERPCDQNGTTDQATSPAKVLNADQEKLRADVEKAMGTMTREELNKKSVFAVAQVLGLTVLWEEAPGSSQTQGSSPTRGPSSQTQRSSPTQRQIPRSVEAQGRTEPQRPSPNQRSPHLPKSSPNRKPSQLPWPSSS